MSLNFFIVVPCILITSRFFSPTRTQHGTQYTHHSLKYLLPQRRISYNDVFSLINSTIF